MSKRLIFVRRAAAGPLLKSHVKGYTRKDGTFVKEHDDKRTKKAAPAGGEKYSHPHVVGKATITDEHSTGPHDAASMQFAGTDYFTTGKHGKSFHDETPVREFENESDGHRVWMDHQARVHADSLTEVDALRKKHEAHTAGQQAEVDAGEDPASQGEAAAAEELPGKGHAARAEAEGDGLDWTETENGSLEVTSPSGKQWYISKDPETDQFEVGPITDSESEWEDKMKPCPSAGDVASYLKQNGFTKVDAKRIDGIQPYKDSDDGAGGYDKAKSSEPFNHAQAKAIADAVMQMQGVGPDKVGAAIQALIDSPAFKAAGGAKAAPQAAKPAAGASGAPKAAAAPDGAKKGADAESKRRGAVDDAIASSNRSGKKIGGKEAKAIHSLLSPDRHKPSAAAKPAASSAPVTTKNEGMGFHGATLSRLTSNEHGVDTSHYDLPEKEQVAIKAKADAQFDKAAKKLVSLGHFKTPAEAGDFLDSRMGRHLGDEADGADSIGKIKWLGKAVAEYKKDPDLPFGGSKPKGPALGQPLAKSEAAGDTIDGRGPEHEDQQDDEDPGETGKKKRKGGSLLKSFGGSKSGQGSLFKALASGARLLLKSNVAGYTKKDGTHVAGYSRHGRMSFSVDTGMGNTEHLHVDEGRVWTSNDRGGYPSNVRDLSIPSKPDNHAGVRAAYDNSGGDAEKARAAVSAHIGRPVTLKGHDKNATYAKHLEDKGAKAEATKVASVEGAGRYEYIHGKKPRGFGNWCFSPHKIYQHGFHPPEDQFNHSGSFWDAKAAAAKWGKSKGHSVVHLQT